MDPWIITFVVKILIDWLVNVIEHLIAFLKHYIVQKNAAKYLKGILWRTGSSQLMIASSSYCIHYKKYHYLALFMSLWRYVRVSQLSIVSIVKCAAHFLENNSKDLLHDNL